MIVSAIWTCSRPLSNEVPAVARRSPRANHGVRRRFPSPERADVAAARAATASSGVGILHGVGILLESEWHPLRQPLGVAACVATGRSLGRTVPCRDAGPNLRRVRREAKPAWRWVQGRHRGAHGNFAAHRARSRREKRHGGRRAGRLCHLGLLGGGASKAYCWRAAALDPAS